VVISGWSIGWAVDDSVVKGLGSLAISLTCVGFCDIPRGMSLKIALSGHHLVNPTSVELVETDERVECEREGVSIFSWMRGGGAPLFHQEVTALLLQLGIGWASWLLWIGIEEVVLGGDWEWLVALRS